ncbi:cysteine hydrolase family protein [Kallotenue papyrolyticum]|uniref:cysteine hydrolase family protein n=1 Tax=Kallotenue papyrolyticum TaxID=1325125 RepID=UPI0004786503|nr:isochorismatase family cysteine hydrolase [Kallotenue papyrolyticum]
MPPKNHDLHGNAPDMAPVALLIIDMISDFEFEDGERLFAQALPVAQHLAVLKRRCKAAAIPVIYVNDNWGRWQSNLEKLVHYVVETPTRGAPIARLLAPEADDYFVLKPKQSGFFATTLETLLRYLETRLLILTGVAGDICVLFTANDAYMRDFMLVVPEDCVASVDAEANQRALLHCRRVLRADLTPSQALDLAALRRQAQAPAE